MKAQWMAFLAVGALALTGCGNSDEAKSVDTEIKTVQDIELATAPVVAAVKAPTMMVSQAKIYFDFDKENVKASESTALFDQVNYLNSTPTATVVVEGHADERGSKEYNMALGDRRAQSVKSAMVDAGVAADRIETVSFGEDKPAEMGHNESAWSMNRRVEFKYQ
jgi:peptidoglycan-associated lipoprotein